MIHILLRDQLQLKDLKDKHKIGYALLSTVNTSNDVIESLVKSTLKRPTHLKIRYQEFLCFAEKTKIVIEDKIPEIYLKYGGMCFLHSNGGLEKERIEAFKNHLNYIFQFDYDIDPVGNNGMLDLASPGATIDKLILELAFKEKDSSILNYAYTNELLKLEKEEIIKVFNNLSIEEVKNNKKLFSKIE